MTSLPTQALAQARADWLSGDVAAWTRYLACLARLEACRAESARPAGQPAAPTARGGPARPTESPGSRRNRALA